MKYEVLNHRPDSTRLLPSAKQHLKRIYHLILGFDEKVLKCHVMRM